MHKRNFIHCGNCLEFMRSIPNRCIKTILTSPPYNIGNMRSGNNVSFGTYDGNDMLEADYQEWQLTVLQECYRILADDGHLFYNHKIRIRNGMAIHPMEWLLKSPFILKQEIIWDQGGTACFDHIRFYPVTERIYWLTKSARTQLRNTLKLTDVWDIHQGTPRKDRGHIAVMPVKIAKRCLISVPDGLVFDPFMGSGTTAIAALSFGREYIGCEISEAYCELARRNIKNYLRQGKLEL